MRTGGTYHNVGKERAVHTTGNAIVISILPDVCLTPFGPFMIPLPYQVIGFCDEVMNASPSTGTEGTADLTMASRLTTVYGDESGILGGMISGVNTGYCRPITNSPTVGVDGNSVVMNNSLFWMNCAGPEGPGNTIGKVLYVTAEAYTSLFAAAMRKRTCVCDPVDVATGTVLTFAKDISFFGTPALELVRYYASHGVHQKGIFGPGWSSLLDLKLDILADKIVFHDAEGRPILFPLVEAGGSYFNLGEKLTLVRQKATIRVTSQDGLSYRFSLSPERARGCLEAISTGIGQTLVFSYESGRLMSIKASGSRIYRLEYDTGNRLIAVHGPAPSGEKEIRLRGYEYDAQDRLITVCDEYAHPFRYEYDKWHRLTKKTTRNGYSIFYEYGDDGRCARSWGEDGMYYGKFKYYTAQRKTEVIDARGEKTVYYSNHNGLVTRKIDALGGVLEYHYDADGNLIAEVDENGHTVTHDYDDQGRQISKNDEENNLWKADYGSGIPKHTDPLNNRITYIHDQWGNVIRTWDGQGNRRAYPYQRETIRKGKKIKSTDWLVYPGSASNKKTACEYDLKGRLIAETDRNDNRTTYGYDAEDNLIRIQDPLGNQREFTYRGFNKKVAERDENGHAIYFEYNAQARLAAVINEKGERHEFKYDALDRLIEDEGFDGQVRGYEYDPAGNVIRVKEADGALIKLSYDRTGKVTEIKGIDKEGGTCRNTYRYDDAGRLIEAGNEHSVVKFEYDPLGRVIRECQGEHVVERGYDSAGNLVSRKGPWSSVIGFKYDVKGKLSEVVLPGDKVIRYARDASGRPIERHLPGGTYSQCTHDAADNLLSQDIRYRGAPLIQRKYQYNARGQLTRLSDTEKESKQYYYDKAKRLSGVVNAHREQETFVYDPAGNLLNMGKGENAVYVKGNRLISWNGTGHEYDLRGNLIRKTNGQGTFCYHYNLFNQLISLEGPDGIRVDFQYDALGRRLSKKHSNKREVKYSWDQFQLLGEEENGKGVEYVFHPDHFVPIALLENGEPYFYHTDHLGTPQEITNEDGTIVWSGAYETLGFCKVIGTPAITNNLRFQGQYFDKETGLHYNIFRYYDPETGRYITRDPINYLSEDFNLYRYAKNDPVDRVDPLSLDSGGEEDWPSPAQPTITSTVGITYTSVIGGDTVPCDMYVISRYPRDPCAMTKPLWFSLVGFDERGQELLGHWLSGCAEELQVHGGEWGRYMMANELLRGQLIDQLVVDAKNRTDTGTVDIDFPARIENGYITGYQMLHGTYLDKGDFQIKGKATVVSGSEDYGLIKTIKYDLTYTWNDIIDPKVEKYQSDRILRDILNIFYDPADYDAHISWSTACTVTIGPNTLEGSGYPFDTD